MRITLWRRTDGRIGWSYSNRKGASIMSFHHGWKRDYEAGRVGDEDWRRESYDRWIESLERNRE